MGCGNSIQASVSVGKLVFSQNPKVQQYYDDYIVPSRKQKNVTVQSINDVVKFIELTQQRLSKYPIACIPCFDNNFTGITSIPKGFKTCIYCQGHGAKQASITDATCRDCKVDAIKPNKNQKRFENNLRFYQQESKKWQDRQRRLINRICDKCRGAGLITN